jgi:hypothetical protein
MPRRRSTGFRPRFTPPAGVVAFAAALVVTAAARGVVANARGVVANAAPKRFFVTGRSDVVLSARNNPPIKVARVDLALDFRRAGRGASSASYRLENVSDLPWEDDVVFVASAEDVAVFVDGRPAAVAPAGPGLEARVSTAWIEGTRTEQRSFVFHLALEPHAARDLRVTFRTTAGGVSENVDAERQADGLTRLVPRERIVSRRAHFTYPLWPAVGFGGGVGEMRATVRASAGAQLEAGRTPFQRQARADGEVEFSVRVPPSHDQDSLAADRLTVRYALPDPPPLLGASAFVALRALDVDGKGLGANGRLSGDLVFFDNFGLSLGAETDFTRTISGVATLARGTANVYGSGYYGGGVVVAARPGVAVGLEANAGARFFVVPLDLALQVYPYRDDRARDVGVVRLLVGLKLGL